MIRRARAKAGTFPGTSFTVGDAADPPLPAASYAVVLCRHVLWALPSPADALRRWVELLERDGRLVLIEGRWSTGGGLTGEETCRLVEGAGLDPEVRTLDDPAYWGRRIDDERYVVVGRRRP
jgi:SAM-dependent methyltransferase